MKVICKLGGASCPKGLDICCVHCDDRANCTNYCDLHTREQCDDMQVIPDALTPFETAVPDTIHKITSLMRLKKEMDEQERQLKQKLLEAMEAYGIKSFENEELKLLYVAPTSRSTLDTTKLKKDHPDLAEAYTRTSTVSASVRVTVK